MRKVVVFLALASLLFLGNPFGTAVRALGQDAVERKER
jgi:hypothetical protein